MQNKMLDVSSKPSNNEIIGRSAAVVSNGTSSDTGIIRAHRKEIHRAPPARSISCQSVSGRCDGDTMALITGPEPEYVHCSPQVPSQPPPPPPPRPPPQGVCIHGHTLAYGSSRSSNGPENRSAEQNVPPTSTATAASEARQPWWKSWRKKYVVLCATCGLSCVMLGSCYLAIYFVLRSYTHSLEFFQSMPTYVPAVVQITTGLWVLCFMSRRNRLSYLIKIVGCLCVASAVVSVVVTVTTTVVHMNRLQTLKECTFYTQLHSCTCLPFTDEVSFEIKLTSTVNNCDIIHGPLYACLRAMFGVSVIGILVSIFSCMLVYQLLSHEKKKMYWEQLESRQRLHYQRRIPNSVSANSCGCSADEYGFAQAQSEASSYPWRVWERAEDGSVLLGNASQNPSTPSLWLPCGGSWGSRTNSTQLPGVRDSNNERDSSLLSFNTDTNRGSESCQINSGVILRPCMARGMDPHNFRGLLRPPNFRSSRRPLSDPGYSLQMHYPPPFRDNFMPPLLYQGIDAIPRYMWDPPPPYSQPPSTENLLTAASSTRPDDVVGEQVGALEGVNTSPARVVLNSEQPTSPRSVLSIGSQLQIDGLKDLDHLPLTHRARPLPLAAATSLSDLVNVKYLTDTKFCSDVKYDSGERNNISHEKQTKKLFTLKGRSSRVKTEPKPLPICLYGKTEQESELYFADVSSCVSARNDDIDGNEEILMYYTDPKLISQPSISHLYEQVEEKNRANDINDDDDDSHHASDDTMIVHTSSSDRSVEPDGDNSVPSPQTDTSSASPMATDTDAYSGYQMGPVKPNSCVIASTQPNEVGNLNLDPNLQDNFFNPHNHPHMTNHFHNYLFYTGQQTNILPHDKKAGDPHLVNASDTEPRYEIIQVSQGTTDTTSADLNGNIGLPPTQINAVPIPVTTSSCGALCQLRSPPANTKGHRKHHNTSSSTPNTPLREAGSKKIEVTSPFHVHKHKKPQSFDGSRHKHKKSHITNSPTHKHPSSFDANIHTHKHPVSFDPSTNSPSHKKILYEPPINSPEHKHPSPFSASSPKHKQPTSFNSNPTHKHKQSSLLTDHKAKELQTPEPRSPRSHKFRKDQVQPSPSKKPQRVQDKLYMLKSVNV